MANAVNSPDGVNLLNAVKDVDTRKQPIYESKAALLAALPVSKRADGLTMDYKENGEWRTGRFEGGTADADFVEVNEKLQNITEIPDRSYNDLQDLPKSKIEVINPDGSKLPYDYSTSLVDAVADAPEGGTVIVFPGIYLVGESILKNNVNLFFYDGAIIKSINETSIFIDNGNDINFNIDGKGTFINTSIGEISENKTVMYLSGNSSGTIRGKLAQSEDYRCFQFNGSGNINVHFEKIKSAAETFDAVKITGVVNIYANEAESENGEVIDFDGTLSDAKFYCFIDKMTGTSDSGIITLNGDAYMEIHYAYIKNKSTGRITSDSSNYLYMFNCIFDLQNEHVFEYDAKIANCARVDGLAITSRFGAVIFLNNEYTDEQAQDAIGTILSSDFTYDDATPAISLNDIAQSKVTGLVNALAGKVNKAGDVLSGDVTFLDNSNGSVGSNQAKLTNLGLYVGLKRVIYLNGGTDIRTDHITVSDIASTGIHLIGADTNGKLINYTDAIPVSQGGTGKTSIGEGKILVGNASGGFNEDNLPKFKIITVASGDYTLTAANTSQTTIIHKDTTDTAAEITIPAANAVEVGSTITLVPWSRNKGFSESYYDLSGNVVTHTGTEAFRNVKIQSDGTNWYQISNY